MIYQNIRAEEVKIKVGSDIKNLRAIQQEFKIDIWQMIPEIN